MTMDESHRKIQQGWHSFAERFSEHVSTETDCLGAHFEAKRQAPLSVILIDYNNHCHYNPFLSQLETLSLNLSVKVSCPLSITVTVLVLH